MVLDHMIHISVDRLHVLYFRHHLSCVRRRRPAAMHQPYILEASRLVAIPRTIRRIHAIIVASTTSLWNQRCPCGPVTCSGLRVLSSPYSPAKLSPAHFAALRLVIPPSKTKGLMTAVQLNKGAFACHCCFASRPLFLCYTISVTRSPCVYSRLNESCLVENRRLFRAFRKRQPVSIDPTSYANLRISQAPF
jgi:hypothetical protein